MADLGKCAQCNGDGFNMGADGPAPCEPCKSTGYMFRIMVDELRIWPSARYPFRSGSCHLTVDGPIDHLHVFAAKIGMRRRWFQDHPLAPHYDLTPGRRAAARLAGAIEVPAKEQMRKVIARRRAANAAVLGGNDA